MAIVVADTGAIISLIHIEKLSLIEDFFGKFYISEAVFIELTNYDNPDFDNTYLIELKSKIQRIKSKNHLELIMDYGESESVILYEELGADFLLIDDYKARQVAESFGVKCIGTLAVLIKAKQKGLINNLKPIFEQLLSVGRYFSKQLLNDILMKFGEKQLKSGNQ